MVAVLLAFVNRVLIGHWEAVIRVLGLTVMGVLLSTLGNCKQKGRKKYLKRR